MKLVIVETSAQAKRLSDALGEGWRVEPCSGMVRDLPADQLGIDLAADFRPTFTVVQGKGNLVRRLMKALRDCEAVYAAMPPTHEGEALAWHVLALSPDMKDKSVYRVTLTALTPDAIHAAFAAPRPLDMKLIEAHTAERSFSRLVGWSVNAAARQALDFKTALTVDCMVALRLLMERNAQIGAFTSETRWRANVSFVSDGSTFRQNRQHRVWAVRRQHALPTIKIDQHRCRPQFERIWLVFRCANENPRTHQLVLRGRHVSSDEVLPDERINCRAIPRQGFRSTAHVSRRDPGGSIRFCRQIFGAELAADVCLRRFVKSGRCDGIRCGDPARIVERGNQSHRLLGHKIEIAGSGFDQAAQRERSGCRLHFEHLPGLIDPELTALEQRLKLSCLFRRADHQRCAFSVQHMGSEWNALQPASITVEAVTSDAPVPFSDAGLISALVESGVSVSAAVAALAGLRGAGYVDGEGVLSLTEVGRTVAAYLAEHFGELTAPAFAREWVADIERIASGERQRADVLRAFWERFGGILRPAPTVRAAAEHKPIVLRPAEEV